MYLCRWCIIEKFTRISNVVCIVFEGISLEDFLENRDKFHFLNQFTNKVEVISPFTYDGDIVSDLSAVSLADNDRASLLKSKDCDSCMLESILGEEVY